VARFDRLVGQTLDGTYTIGRLIGKGGMGAIFAATHARLPGKHVAIKVLAPELAENTEVLLRFRREAEIASRLGHENIVDVHDFNVWDGMAYLVMELLDGEDLDQRIKSRGPMALDAVEHIVGQIASALEAAHRAHIVHRDLKPQNVFLCRRGGRDDFVKVLDFGISKVLDSSSVVTRDQALMGTPFYMSPEQADGRVQEIDARTDVFALGAIIWEMLVGRMAFGAPTLSVALYKVAFVDPPEVHLIRPDVPPGVSAVLRRALAKERTQRTPSALELMRELGDALRGGVLAGLPVPAPAPGGTDSLAGLRAAPASQPAGPPPAVGTAPASFVRGSMAQVEPGPPRRLGVIAASVLAGAALAGGGWALLSGQRAQAPAGPEPAPASAPASAPTAPAPTVAAEVTLTFAIEPADVAAQIDVDGRPVPGREVRLPRSATPVRVTVDAKGYLTHREPVVPDQDRAVAVMLKRRPPAPRPSPATEPAPPVATPTSAPTRPPPQQPPPRKTGTIFDQP
jgi:serine/threonine-protein kinase